MRRCACWLSLTSAVAVAAAAASIESDSAAGAAEPRPTVLQLIDRSRQETWRWERLMGVPRTPTTRSERPSVSTAYRRWVLRLWRGRAERARKRASRPPHLAAWRCIHRYEGPWNDPNPPYYGGLQMDLAFQRAHGRELLRSKGTADRWSPLEQMWVAERALRRGTGFYPWPTAARICGLI